MEQKKRTVVLKLDPKDYEAFKAAAVADGLTLSGWMRFELRRVIRKRENG